MIRIKTSGLSVLSCLCMAALLQSCSSDDVVRRGVPEPDYDSPIEMSTAFTKAMDPLANSNLHIQKFDISAIWNYDGSSTNKWYIDTQEVVRNGSSQWVTAPMSYWPVLGNLSFFFYAPSKTVAGSMINFNKENTGMPSVTFIPLTHDVSDQVDMCMAQPVLNVTKQIGPVPADLYHTLTQVWFDMNYKGTLPDPNYYVLIDQIAIKNVIGCKKCYYAMSAPYYEWQPDSECTADSTYVVSRFTHNELKSGYFTPGIWEYDSLPLETDGVFVPVQNSFGRLYLIPQHIETTTIISITYGFYVKVLDNYVAVASFTKELPMPAAMDWEPNRVVRYKITLDIGLSQPVVTGYVIDDWQSSGNVHSEIFFD